MIISLNGRLKYSLSEDFQGSVFKKLEQPWSETLTKCNNFNEKYQQFQSNLNNFKCNVVNFEYCTITYMYFTS